MYGKCPQCGLVIRMSPNSPYKCPTCNVVCRMMTAHEEQMRWGPSGRPTPNVQCHNCGATFASGAAGTVKCPNCSTIVYVPASSAEEVEQRRAQVAREDRERSRKRELDDAERKRQAAQDAERERREQQQLADKARDFIRNCLQSDAFVIDSNIWMNPEYKSFFTALWITLKTEHKRMILNGAQFDEMCRIKRDTAYGQERNANARYAIGWIADLQDADLLEIEQDASAKRNAYADIEIIRSLCGTLERGGTAYLATDDVELRIRAKEAVRTAPGGTLKIVEFADKLAMFVALCQEHHDFCELNGLPTFDRHADSVGDGPQR